MISIRIGLEMEPNNCRLNHATITEAVGIARATDFGATKKESRLSWIYNQTLDLDNQLLTSLRLS